jgi:hypothetical protein
VDHHHTASDPSGYEYGHLIDPRQDLLRQNCCGNRSDVPPRLVSFDDQRIDPSFDQVLGDSYGGGKAEQFALGMSDLIDCLPRRQPAGEDDKGKLNL